MAGNSSICRPTLTTSTIYIVMSLSQNAQVNIETRNSVQIMSLVEGTTIVLETANGMRQRFNYAETFVVPSAAVSFRLINDTDTTAKVINAFMKPEGTYTTIKG